MTTLISILLVLASIALVLVVIVQKSKGGGLASGFSSANNIMGVRKATDGIEKATWYLMGYNHGTLASLIQASSVQVTAKALN